MTKFCVKKPYFVFVAAILVLVLGVVSLRSMQTDLLPEISLPYLVVVTTYPGASPQTVESQVVEPLEGSLGTINGVKNVNSTSAENYGMVMLEFEESTNMDSAMVKVSSAINQIESTLPEGTGTPSILEISMDMVATMYVSVTMEGKDIYDVSDFSEETVIPYLERTNGVANITDIGLVNRLIEVRLDDQKITDLNDKLLAKVNEKFAEALEEMDKAEKALDDAQKQLDEGKEQLNSQQSTLEQSRKELESQQQATYSQLAQASEALSQLTAYQTQLLSQQANLQALEMAKEQVVSQLQESGLDPETIPASIAEATTGMNTIDTTLLGLNTAASALDSLITAVANVETPDEATMAQIRQLFESLEIPFDENAVSDSLQNARTSVQEQIDTLTAQKGQLQTALDGLNTARQTLDDFDAQITAANVEIATTQAIVSGYESQLASMGLSYHDIETAKLTAAASFGSADAQLAAGQSALEQARTQMEQGQAELDAKKTEFENAKKTYEESKEQALKQANLNALLDKDTLAGVLYAQNFSMPAGYIEDQWLLTIGDEYESVEDIENLLLADVDGIGEVRLKDVAIVTVLDTANETYARSNGETAVVLSIYKSSTVGTNEVSRNLRQAFQELEEQYPGLKISVFMDQGDYINIIVDSLFSNLLWGALLAVIVLVIFLKDVRPTLVVAFSIPFSVMFAIVLMYFSGVSINIVSLSGLTLGIGMLVDNSVVAIENIYRLRARGVSPGRAAVQGVKQIAGAIAASTLTTICVFMPLLFAEGLIKDLMVDMALTITFSLMASLIVAMTVVPTMANTILKTYNARGHRLFDRILKVYEKTLRFCLRFKAVPLILAVALLAWSVYEVTKIGLIMLPDTGSNQLSATYIAEEDLSVEDARTEADRIMAAAVNIEGIESIGAMGSSQAMSLMSSFGGSGTDTSFSFFITLNDGVKSGPIMKKLTEAAGEVKGEFTVETSGSQMLNAYTGSGLQIDVYGTDLDEMLSVTEDVMDIVEQVEGFTEVTNGQEESKETVHLLIDKDKAMAHSLTNAQIFQTVAAALTTEKNAMTVTIDDHEMDIRIVDERHAVKLDSLLDLELTANEMDEEGASHEVIYHLKDFAKTENKPGLSSITRENQARKMSVTAVTEEGYNTTRLAQQVEERMASYEPPTGVKIEVAGESSQVQEMISTMVKMILLAVLLIYLIMVAQFQSLLSPFIVIFTLPLAFTGGMIALLIAGEPLSMMSLMGFLVLAGVVVNNGIVFVDYTNKLRYGGLGKRQALIAAGCTRMRPILMTTLTTVFAMIVMLFSQDVGSAIGRGLAVVSVGGLLYGTLMTLFIIPVMYDIFFRRKEMKEIDVGDNDMDDLPDDAEEFMQMYQ